VVGGKIQGHGDGLSGFSEKPEKHVCHRAVAARAVEAGDIVLDKGDEGAEGDGSVGGPGIVESNDGGDLKGEAQDLEGADDGHACGEAGFFKEPAGDGIRLAVEPDKPPGAEDIERLCPQKRDHREREKGDFSNRHRSVPALGC
jgi:hypothetical protein